MKKLHRQIFWLLIFLLPVQLGRHFWPEWTQVLGLPIDYLSPTLYLTDILVVGILFFWWLDSKKDYTLFAIRQIAKNYWWVGAIFLYLLVTSLLAQNPGVALYKFFKIIEFAFLGFYVAKNRYSIFDSPLRGIPSECRYSISGAVIYSSLIAIVQFIKQASLGGPFWWLGERSFNILTPGIAKAVIDGRLVLRPYATFPHPNVLAGFLLVSMMLIVISNKQYAISRIIKWTVLILGIITIILSFSRSAWLVGLLVGFWLAFRDWWGKKIRIVGLILLTVFIGAVFYLLISSFSGQGAIEQRLALVKVAVKMIRNNPLAGVGLNNFIPQLPGYWQQFGMTYWLQPVHNIFLLIATETGITGLLIFLWLLILTFKKLLVTNNVQLLLLLSVVLLLGVTDHYWLTLQQAQLLLTIVFGLSWRK